MMPQILPGAPGPSGGPTSPIRANQRDVVDSAPAAAGPPPGLQRMGRIDISSASRMQGDLLHSLLKQPAQRTEREIIQIRFLLCKHPAFQHLGEKALHTVSRAVTIEQYRAGDIVYRLGEPVERVYFMESGRCEQYRITPEELKFLKAPVPKNELAPHAADKGRPARRGALKGDEMRSSAFQVFLESPAPPLMYSVRARSMLALSAAVLALPCCRVWMLKRGAATLDQANWVSLMLDVDGEGMIRAQDATGVPAVGPFSADYGRERCLDRLSLPANVVGSIREVWRVEEFSLGAFNYIVRVEFTRGDFLCVSFESGGMRKTWVEHLKSFRDAEDQVTRTLIAKRRSDAAFIAGDLFGAEEMRNPNPIEAQISPRDATVLCKTDAVMFVLRRFDFLCAIEKSPIFSLQERISTLKLACILPPTSTSSLFKAARALQPEQYLLNQVVCRAGMRVEAVYVVFRGFASICEDNLKLQVQQDQGSLNERGSTYTSKVRKVEKLGVGDAFGHVDAVSEDCIYQHTLVADTNKTVILRLPLAIFLGCWEEANPVDEEGDPAEQGARHVPGKVGTAASHLLKSVKDPRNKTPTIAQMLEVHSFRVPQPPVSKRTQHRRTAFESEATSLDELLDPSGAGYRACENEDLFSQPDPDNGVDLAVCTEIEGDDLGLDRDVMDTPKIEVIRRQFRIAPPGVRQTASRKAAWKGVCDYQPKEPSLPKVDLLRFMKNAHTDDQDDDEAGFDEFGVDEDCRDVVRSLRKVLQWRAPTQRSASQRIKDLVIDSQFRTPETHGVGAVSAMTTDLVLRIDRLPGKSGKYAEDSIRYVLRDLAIMPGGILVYPDSNEGNSTVFVKFDKVEDFHSGLSKVLMLGMFAQESTADELATFHVLHTFKKAAKPQTLNTARPSTSSHGMLQGTRVRSSHGARTPRSPRLRATPCQARVPDLAAVGSSRPCTAPTSSESQLQISDAWQRTPRRPGTTQPSQRPGPSLRQERVGTKRLQVSAQMSDVGLDAPVLQR